MKFPLLLLAFCLAASPLPVKACPLCEDLTGLPGAAAPATPAPPADTPAPGPAAPAVTTLRELRQLMQQRAASASGRSEHQLFAVARQIRDGGALNPALFLLPPLLLAGVDPALRPAPELAGR